MTPQGFFVLLHFPFVTLQVSLEALLLYSQPANIAIGKIPFPRPFLFDAVIVDVQFTLDINIVVMMTRPLPRNGPNITFARFLALELTGYPINQYFFKYLNTFTILMLKDNYPLARYIYKSIVS